MTPFLNPQGEPRIKYNEALCRTRVLIEQTFGILKRRFQVFRLLRAINLSLLNITEKRVNKKYNKHSIRNSQHPQYVSQRNNQKIRSWDIQELFT